MATETLHALLRERILVFDGAMGTMLQGYGLGEAEFRGKRFVDHPRDLAGCNDLLSLTQPRIVEEIHERYLEAGADLIETNTFTAQSISLADYGLEAEVFAINQAAAEAAVRVARRVSLKTPDQPRFAAGSIGPTNRTASLSPDVNDPAYRAATFDDLALAYLEQVRGLLAGGVDLLVAETSFDTLNLKAALFAIETAFDELGRRVPVIASITITDASGRTLSGQTVEAAWTSISHADLLAAGINCALGAQEMRPHVEELARVASTFVACYPNAGLPNEFGGYDQSPEEMSGILGEFADAGWLNLVGGCCGTGPEHIQAIAERVAGLAPHKPAARSSFSVMSGLEPLTIRPDSNFIVIGERTNVTGSRRFARLIRAGELEPALAVARQQVEGGANILDVNMDEGLLDSVAAMTSFLNLVAAEPEISRLPIMIDSSRFEVIEAGLKCLQGKGVVNSISLKEGEAEFIRQARLVRRYGAAVVVMAFDEEGQAVTVERKVEILTRAHRILTEQLGFPESDIVFDPNILTVATGIEEHDDYALAFLEATRHLKQRFPAAKVSGGLSNVSFSFRGNAPVREAMHAAFLYHGIRAGLDMAIVNAGQLAVYDDIPPELLERVEDVLLARRPDATERLVEFASTVRGSRREQVQTGKDWRNGSLEERLSHALVHGVGQHVGEDVAEALERFPTPLSIIDGPLMAGMSVVGRLFGEGKMFLPQVVKSARVMKQAVAILEPLIDAGQLTSGVTEGRARIVLATVKGDVHDIGKNIVGVVLGCNHHRVIDLGVMVSAERILDAAREHEADMIGLSGLITPSLDEMVHVAREMQRSGFEIPLLIGGATTSAKHTAVRIAPDYGPPSIHVTDASKAVEVVGRLIRDEGREAYLEQLRADQEKARVAFAGKARRKIEPYDAARKAAPRFEFGPQEISRPAFTGTRLVEELSLETIVPYIDWTPFFHAWELRGVYPKILEDPRYGEAARELYDHARAMLEQIVSERLIRARGVYGFFPANRDGDDLVLFADDRRTVERTRLHSLRQQESGSRSGERLALADFVAPAGAKDFLGAFAVTAGIGLDDWVGRLEAAGDDYRAIMAKALADRLAEAFAEWLHETARRDWGYGAEERLTKQDLIRDKYRGIRPAPGYPACPDHSEKSILWELLDVEAQTGIRLTESWAMQPAASVSGLYFGHPAARYFAVGRLGRDQIEDYAARKDLSLPEVERRLRPWLAYEP